MNGLNWIFEQTDMQITHLILDESSKQYRQGDTTFGPKEALKTPIMWLFELSPVT